MPEQELIISLHWVHIQYKVSLVRFHTRIFWYSRKKQLTYYIVRIIYIANGLVGDGYSRERGYCERGVGVKKDVKERWAWRCWHLGLSSRSWWVMTGIKSPGGPDETWKKLRLNWNFGRNQKFFTRNWTKVENLLKICIDFMFNFKFCNRLLLIPCQSTSRHSTTPPCSC